LLSVADDGTLFTYRIDMESVKAKSRGEIIDAYTYPDLAGGLTENTYADKIELLEEEEEDIIDDSKYSV
jgi:hypothetical protein